MNDYYKEELRKIVSTLEEMKDALTEIECEDEDCDNIGMAGDNLYNAIMNIYKVIEE